jgi:hypothetical protein
MMEARRRGVNGGEAVPLKRCFMPFREGRHAVQYKAELGVSVKVPR